MAHLTEPMDEEQKAEFITGLYDDKGSDDVAKDQLRAHLAAQGVEWDGEI